MDNLEYWIRKTFFPSSLDNIDKMIFKCYKALYKAATPAANFQTLVDTAVINERGEKEIPFMEYEIDEETYDKIVEKYMNRLKPVYRRRAFKTTIALGCSPRTTVK